MFVGHLALAFAAKRAAPAVSLGTLILACQLADLLWPTFCLLGLEDFAIAPGITVVTPLDFQSYPYSHSLLALSVYGVAVALAYKVIRRTPPAAAVTVIAALVLSHWFLDVISHRPDMPLTIAGETKLGLGLWNSLPATLIVELAMLIAGVVMYTRTTRPMDRTGTYTFAGLIAFLLAINLANTFGPPPPSVKAVSWSAQAIWLLVAWGYWIDRHRRPR